MVVSVTSTTSQASCYSDTLDSTIEVNVGIICACMPTLRLILIRIFPRLGGTRTPSGRYYNKKYSGQSRSGDNVIGSINVVGEKGIESHIEQDMIIEEDDKNRAGRYAGRRPMHDDDEVELVQMHSRPGR